MLIMDGEEAMPDLECSREMSQSGFSDYLEHDIYEHKYL